MSDPLVGQALQPEDRVSALAFAGASQALAVRLPAELVLDEPVLSLGPR